MKTGYELTIEQTQKPRMTQELIQAIQILQYNNQELIEYIENELLENPILEAQKDKASEETVDIDELRERLLEIHSETKESEYAGSWDQDREEFSFERYVAFRQSLIEYLLSQLEFSGLTENDLEIGKFLIQSIDDNGYLTATVQDIARLVNAEENQVEDVLSVIQGFEPHGVGARSLKECLLIQLRLSGEDQGDIVEVIENRLEDIGSNRISVIAKDMNLSINRIQEISDKIKKLDPKPGRLFDSDSTIKYVVPDIFIDKDGEKLSVRSNDLGFNLLISPLYYDLKENNAENEEVKKYITEKYNSAIWLMKSIEQRKSTINKIANAILEFQNDFFKNGPKNLKPLTLKQVGEKVGVHESTVSRSINGKYLQCEQGVYELKYFFSAGLKADDGEDLSSNSVKQIIKETIEGEDPRKPLSDLQISKILANDGINVSRRTVTKYREAMGIQSSLGRKRY